MSGQTLIFTKGMEGSWELSAPFTNAVRPKARYTVRSVQALSAIIADGRDPRAVYDQYQVPEKDYIADLQADSCILGLQSDAGEWVYVPQAYVVNYPTASGVSYRPLALVVPLGKQPDDINLENLVADANVLAMKHLGVEAASRIVGNGAAELVDPLDHERFVLQRKNAASTMESPAAKLVRYEREIATLTDQVKMLQDALKKLA